MFKSFISVLKENYSPHTYLSEVLLKNKQTNNKNPKSNQGMRAAPASESQRQSDLIRIVCFASIKIKSIVHSSNK